MEMHISEELNDIVKYSRDEAMRTGSYGIGIDHLFLGLLRHGSNDACTVLKALGLEPDQAKQYVDTRILRAESIPYSYSDQIVLSRSAQNILNIAILEASRLGHSNTGSLHLLLALSRTTDVCTSALFRTSGISYASILQCMHDAGIPHQDENGHQTEEPAEESRSEPPREETVNIEDYGTDLTRAAAAGLLDPVVGRDEEIGRVIEILGRRKKNNPMLIGEPGVGKSAIVEGIAIRISSGNASPALKGSRLISLDIASVVAGTRYRGDFEKRLKQIITTLKAHPEIILFIDEFHTVVGAGGAQGSLDAANILKPALARGEIQCIGATTLEEFAHTVEKDGALERRFQKVIVEPTDAIQTVSILKNLRANYETFHGVKYTDGAIEACVRLTDRYITDRALPDKAIDALDEAGSMAHIRATGRGGETVTEDDIAAVISRMSGIPVNRVAESEGHRLLAMKEWLSGRVVGQNDAVDTVVRAIRRSRAGIKDPHRPVGTFLFLGPTGVGKTRLAKCLAEYLFDSEDNLIRIDMSEYSEKISSSRLIGAPPGYVGYERGGQLSEKVRRKPYSVILLDEIEKAHPDIFNLLLQMLDDGRLTDSNGRTVDFKNTVVIMTSNAGTRELEEYGNGIGFSRGGRDLAADRKALLDKAVRKSFPPEFLNRIDEKIFFNPLDRTVLESIIDIELRELRGRAAEAGYTMNVSAEAKKFVADAGYDPVYGARPLKRAITRYIEDPVSEYIITRRMLGEGDSKVILSIGMTPDGTMTRVTGRSRRR